MNGRRSRKCANGKPRVEQSDRRFRSVGDFEFGHDVRHVMLDRLVTDVELERDALVAQTGRDQR